MKYITCTIRTFSKGGEDCWIISVPADSAKAAAVEMAGLLSGSVNKVVFSDRKNDFVVTADSVTCNNRRIRITRIWLQCIEKLFTHNIHPGCSHIDYDFSDKSGDISITVRIV